MQDFVKDRTMRVVIRDKSSAWKEVISAVTQGLLLAATIMLPCGENG